jgi:predicted Ser/Thr protein kinase
MSEHRASSSWVSRIASRVETRFKEGRRVLSFAEYLELFSGDPRRYARDASRYLRDAVDHYGTESVTYPWGEFQRYKVFDLPWEKATDRPNGVLIGQEQVQEEVVRALNNFAREGKPSRLVLLHGPNGSAKSTTVGCLMAALEDYSHTDEGALYRFNWIFPTSKSVRGSLGFGSTEGDAGPGAESFAHLADNQVDAKLLVEVRDHPLFLIPVSDRASLLDEAFTAARVRAKQAGLGDVEPPSEYILRGQLSHKSQQVFEALLASYQGSYSEVLKHVQVERYFISRRYKTGAVTIGPQMSVDAAERQVTADRSLSSLPTSLQAMTLYEVKGELVDAAGGLLEFSDLLKRPLEAFKYLQLTVETQEVQLTQQNVQLNCVMMGSANELHLDAFREHPEFPSFRGRLELIRTPYLRSYLQEQRIYEANVAPQVRAHIAPHAIFIASLFAVLTRMRKPNGDKYPLALGHAINDLTAIEKADLYALGKAPERFEGETQKLLVGAIGELYQESDNYPIYEGRMGASPREMRVVLLDAAQSPSYAGLSPLAVLEAIDTLCMRKNEFDWLQQDALPGGYHDTGKFRKQIFERLLDLWEGEMYVASGLVEEDRYGELFGRYIQNVSAWVKKERLFNRVTQDYEEPDEKTMTSVEELLDVKGDPSDWRKATISAIAAWALDHPGKKIDGHVVFPQLIKRMKDSIFGGRKHDIARIARDMVVLHREDGAGLDFERTKEAAAAIDRMVSRFGYERGSAIDAVTRLLAERFADL